MVTSCDCQILLLGMPTIEEVCTTFGLTDVDVQYSDTDLENLTTYKLFQQHVRPLLVKENPKVIVFDYGYFKILYKQITSL